jgi:hypothetical protein
MKTLFNLIKRKFYFCFPFLGLVAFCFSFGFGVGVSIEGSGGKTSLGETNWLGAVSG